jgi:hypothetical protein
LETKTLLIPIMSGSAKSPAEGLKDLECKWGVITTQPPIPYVATVNPYKKQEKTKIKTRLPDGTHYQMVPFHSGTNKEYINHVIAMICLLVEQKDLKNSMEKAFVTVSEIKEKVGPINKKINLSKSAQEKEGLEKTLKTTEKALELLEKNTLKEVVKCYELFCTYFVGKARTQWDKVIQEMHRKDPWVGLQWTGHLTKDPARRLGNPSWTASNSTSSPSSPVTPLSCSDTTCSSTSGSPSALRCEPL